jgi:hypothetical protein
MNEVDLAKAASQTEAQQMEMLWLDPDGKVIGRTLIVV